MHEARQHRRWCGAPTCWRSASSSSAARRQTTAHAQAGSSVGADNDPAGPGHV